ncbi:hypothetical protein DERP_006624 [Dermatophagoides pteronyssinus]|uniref:Uncharacterized protein n=1 Tax=Dermatophagoides pteronyssinus TaxID=6956 RepID=A0ABQ8IQQ9_DERPT|nr:hypothetical protein DERP_006624 [Dermatophagoides pteronyssinus]
MSFVIILIVEEVCLLQNLYLHFNFNCATSELIIHFVIKSKKLCNFIEKNFPNECDVDNL